jgi:hypothetical protein
MRSAQMTQDSGSIYSAIPVLPEEPFFASDAVPELLPDQEPVGHRRHGHVMVPAQPAAAFEVIEPEFVLELRVVLLDPPARFRPPDQLHQGDAPGASDEPVLRRLGGGRRPLDKQPLLVLRRFALPEAMGWPDSHTREARREFPFAPCPPRHGVVRGGRQRAGHVSHTVRSLAAVVPARGRSSAPGVGPSAPSRSARPRAGSRFDAHGIGQSPRPQPGPECRDRAVAGIGNHPLIGQAPGRCGRDQSGRGSGATWAGGGRARVRPRPRSDPDPASTPLAETAPIPRADSPSRWRDAG